MRVHTHITGGLLLATSMTCLTGLYKPVFSTDIVTTGMSLINFALYITGSSSGSILPDIEKKGSSISNKHKISAFFARHIFTHRGATHSLLALFIIALFLTPICIYIPFGFGTSYSVGLLIGYGSHIILDSFNPLGVPVFYPFSYRFSIGKFKTGKISEWVFFSALIVMLYILTDKFILSSLPYESIKEVISPIKTTLQTIMAGI